MILEIDDWKFDIDMERTMEYSANEAADHCDCAYCRNFYGAIDRSHPLLRPFLAQFGLDIEAPDELMPFTATNIAVYYAVSGRILQFGKSGIFCDRLTIYPELPEVSLINTECPRPIFIIHIGCFDLPWVLDEPLVEDEIISPANEPAFLKKMWQRLLGKSPKDSINS